MCLKLMFTIGSIVFALFFSFMLRHVARRSCRSRELKDLIRQIFINSIFDSPHTVLIFVFLLKFVASPLMESHSRFSFNYKFR